MPTAAALLGVVGRDRDVARSLIGGNDWCRSSTRPPDRQEGVTMPQVEVDRLTINYEVQGEGEPLLLIPYTSADHACYAFHHLRGARPRRLHALRGAAQERDRRERTGRLRASLARGAATGLAQLEALTRGWTAWAARLRSVR